MPSSSGGGGGGWAARTAPRPPPRPPPEPAPPTPRTPFAPSREYILSCCNEAAQRREALRGEKPNTWFKGQPRATDHSWEKMWDDHLHWKRWVAQPQGAALSSAARARTLL